MIQVFSVTFSQIFVLFLFIVLGYIARKSGKVSEDFSKGLSNLLVYIFVPCLTFGTMADKFRPAVLAQRWVILVVGVVILVVNSVIAHVFAKLFAKSQRKRCIFVFPDISQFGVFRLSAGTGSLRSGCIV